MKDVQDQYSEKSGLEIVVESVIALQTVLIDYGQATIKSDIIKWEKEYREKIKEKNGKSTVLSRFRYYCNLFEYIVETLNRYGMLFDSQPKGYSNVEMNSV